MSEPQSSVDDVLQVEEVLQRIASDLSMIADRSLSVDSVEATRATTRAAGCERVHISFKLGFQNGERTSHGCLLIPLPDAIALAGYMMMESDDVVQEKRSLETLDELTKDAMMEVGNFVGGATDAALRGLGMEAVRARSEGCQGVRADVRPAFDYREGDELIVGRVGLTLGDYEPFSAILMLPVF